jgi:hypothetical protein
MRMSEERKKEYRKRLRARLRDAHYIATKAEREKIAKYRAWLRKHGVDLNEYHRASGF